MPKNWTTDTALMDALAVNLCDAAVILPRQLLRVDELVHQYGMPFSHIQIMIMLSGGDRSISTISTALGIAKPNITPLLDHLSERGYVERIRSQEDRRIVHIHLTDEGKNVIQAIRQTVTGQISAWESRFSRSDMKRLNTALATMLSLMNPET